MQSYDIYRDIARRSGGDVYIGVVGPVRTGKSTFIKRFMDLIVLPNLTDSGEKDRVIDELPQSAAGKTVMTTQPRFVPNEAVEINLSDEAKVKVRMVDCVGYLVGGAQGHLEDDVPRMVRTPWFDYDIPFEKAADIGTRKVINDHSTIGIVLTTDGSITDIPRSSYIEAEERVISELKGLNKPFVVILNSNNPKGEDAQVLKEAMQEKYGVKVLLMDILRMNENDIDNLLLDILYEFPINEIKINVPKFLLALSPKHPIMQELTSDLQQSMGDLSSMRDVSKMLNLSEGGNILGKKIDLMRLDQGFAQVSYSFPENLFYQILGEECGNEILDDFHLMAMIKGLVHAKKEYDRMEEAIQSVYTSGYGLIPPSMDELTLEEPEIIKQGGRFGVKLKASAPSLHLIRVDIKTEVSPIVGTEKQSEELVRYLMSEFETDPAKIWNTNIFGKSVNELVREGLSNKLTHMPDDARQKIQETLQRIINEGSGGLICILL